ncbi:MAG: cytochrome B [Chromatiaceae bacterium]|nr:MAG: cytochrome B [Chromatiaceae bacterium]
MNQLYLYPLWLRLWHWLNAALFLVLIATGVSLHYAGPGWLIPFSSAVPVHNTAGILLTLSWLLFVIVNPRSSNARHYRLQLRTLPGELWRQLHYYLHGIFTDAPHPFNVSARRKLNALQQLSYWGALVGLMPILILSGWGFLLSPWLPATLFGVGTIWLVAIAHLASSWLLVLFVIVHLYMITTGATPWSNLHAMLTGWHTEP